MDSFIKHGTCVELDSHQDPVVLLGFYFVQNGEPQEVVTKVFKLGLVHCQRTKFTMRTALTKEANSNPGDTNL